jgi:hypothetical protein
MRAGRHPVGLRLRVATDLLSASSAEPTFRTANSPLDSFLRKSVAPSPQNS